MISTEPEIEITACILTSISELEAISAEWRELFNRCHTTVFQSPDWQLPWIKVFKPARLRVVELRDRGRLRGLAPLLIYPRGAERVLAFAGGGVSDYLDVLIQPGCESQSVSNIVEAITSDDGWTVLDLTDLPAHSALLEIPQLKSYASEHDCTSALSLPASEDELPHLFSKRQRANLRNAQSRLRDAGHSYIEVATGDNFPEFLADLCNLHSSRWNTRGQAGVLDDQKIREFHRISSDLLLRQNMLHLERLRLGDRTLAVIYSLFDRDTAFCYLQGFDPDYGRFSPGTQLMFSVMKNAIHQRIGRFDFLRGQETYKRHWRAVPQPTYRIQMERDAVTKVLAEMKRK